MRAQPSFFEEYRQTMTVAINMTTISLPGIRAEI